MKRTFKTHINHRGFTMVEIVVVLIVLSIVSVIVASRFSTGGNELMIETDGLKSSLRFAQIQSLNDDTDDQKIKWGINFPPNNTSYILYKNGSPAVDKDSRPVMIPVKIPDSVEDPPPNNTHKLQGNVTVVSGMGTTVTFDKWGRPIDLAGNPATNDINITLTQGTESKIITITKNTGFIP